MLSLAVHNRRPQNGWIMPQPVADQPKNDAARLLGRALAALRQRAELSQEAAGERAGITGQGWAKYENGKAPSIHFPNRQLELTAALGFAPADLERERAILAGGGRTATVTELRTWVEGRQAESMIIRDRVQAGAWLMADDSDQGEPRRHAFARDPRFPHADQWLSEVVGDSVDRLGIFSGDLVHCVDVEDSGWSVQSGAIVEIERLRFDGAERELSIKQVEVTPQGVLFWPRSSNPRWQEPLSLTDGADDDVVVRIRGLVVQSIRRF
jgi:transcriptional regulator with XRE-family HTH domain